MDRRNWVTEETGYLRHIRACNPVIEEPFLPWLIEGQVVGWLRPKLAEVLTTRYQVFTHAGDALVLHESLDNFAARTEALRQISEWLAEQGLTGPLLGEPYPVTPAGRESALCVIDRATGAYFGIRAFGQHLNAYVRRNGDLYMWIGRRARDRLIFPGYLDNMVAGGLPHGISLLDNLLKECEEEAELPPELARNAVPVGAVTYNRVAKRGYRPDVLYCYDLELPVDFVPHNRDGEVESFSLLEVQEVARLVRETSEFKLNCNLVVIDFLLRHGFIGPEEEDYLALVSGLRQPLVGIRPASY
jgi:8-oxo-dGTP pyrophosphatase MutT (NUDIX family)